MNLSFQECRICQYLKQIQTTDQTKFFGQHSFVELNHDIRHGHIPNGHARITVTKMKTSTKDSIYYQYDFDDDDDHECELLKEDFLKKFVYLPLIDPLDSL